MSCIQFKISKSFDILRTFNLFGGESYFTFDSRSLISGMHLKIIRVENKYIFVIIKNISKLNISRENDTELPLVGVLVPCYGRINYIFNYEKLLNSNQFLEKQEHQITLF